MNVYSFWLSSFPRAITTSHHRKYICRKCVCASVYINIDLAMCSMRNESLGTQQLLIAFINFGVNKQIREMRSWLETVSPPVLLHAAIFIIY